MLRKLKYCGTILLLIHFANPVFSQSISEQINSIDTRLSKVETTVTQVITDTTLMHLHSLTAFREVIKKNALPEKIKLNAVNEPGTAITVKGIVVDELGNAQTNKLVYVYQTSARGWYADTGVHILQNEGDRKHARLFGYCKTDGFGKFEILTIKPAGYPNSGLPAHIHIEVAIDKGKMLITELQFDDDSRLVGQVRERSIKEHFLIEKNTGTLSDPVYSYRIVTTL